MKFQTPSGNHWYDKNKETLIFHSAITTMVQETKNKKRSRGAAVGGTKEM